MTIINPWKEYWLSRGSNQRPPVLSKRNYNINVDILLWLCLKEKQSHKQLPLFSRPSFCSLDDTWKYISFPNNLLFTSISYMKIGKL